MNSSDGSNNSNGSSGAITKSGQHKLPKQNDGFLDFMGCGSCCTTSGRKSSKRSDYVSSCANSSYFLLNHIQSSKKSEFILILKRESEALIQDTDIKLTDELI